MLILLKLIQYFKPNNILEIGTSLGLSTSILSIANSSAKITTLEGCEQTAKVANEMFQKHNFKNIELVEWGEVPNFDVIINATSLGLEKEDFINLDFLSISKNKLFYDVIYNPKKTNFLLEAEKRGHQIENGKMMFVYQAQEAFRLFTIKPDVWDGLLPSINKKVLQLLDND